MIIIIFITVIIIEQVAAINFVIWLVSFLICSPILVFQVSAFVFVSVYLYFVFCVLCICILCLYYLYLFLQDLQLNPYPNCMEFWPHPQMKNAFTILVFST